MITRLQLLRNIGQFDNVAPAALELTRLTLIYAENGRGKTTISAILRSLATGEALPITERRRLGAAHAPEAIIACAGGAQPARFQNGTWSRTCPDVVVFDDVFVDRSVYSGLDVDAEHRQNLHELILGAQGVTLARRVDDLASQIRNHSADLRIKAAAVPTADRHGLDIDAFCALPEQANIGVALAAAEQRLAALQQAATVQAGREFTSLALPPIDTAMVTQLLQKTVADLDAAAVEAVKGHFAAIGGTAETWVSTGMNFVPGNVLAAEGTMCPFCRQSLDTSALFAHYRAFFGDAYRNLQAELSANLNTLQTTLRGDALAGFERQVKAADELRRFWSKFCAVPDLAIDTTEVARVWQAARDSLLIALRAKCADPLTAAALHADTQAALAAYAVACAHIDNVSRALLAANENVQRVKEATQAGNSHAAESEIRRLRATRARHTPEIEAACAEHLAEKGRKDQAERDKNAAQKTLDAHRTAVFPDYQTSINTHLLGFNAPFSIEQVQPQNTPGRPSCTYHLAFNAHRVPVAAAAIAPGNAAFKNTLSAGDRNTLALAFFFASLDRDPNRARRIVVLDDPISSLDEHRSTATIQEARGLVGQVAQVIILSHSKAFLAQIWQHADHANTACLAVTRDGAASTSTLSAWNVAEHSVTEYDKRHTRLRAYLQANGGNSRDVAESIRPVLEGYLRVACPEHFPPERLLGQFRGIAQQRAAAGTPVLAPAKLLELTNLTEFGNRFHHDTNPAWDNEHINDVELLGFVRRTLEFVKA